MKKSILKDKSCAFAVRVFELSQYLKRNQKDYVLSKQILHSGTEIGALVCEAAFAQSRAYFMSKMSMALEKADETNYLIKLLSATKYIEKSVYESLSADIDEIISLLANTLKTAKQNENNSSHFTLHSSFFTLLFDLDGVIIDSEPQYDKFWGSRGELYNLGHNFAGKVKGQTTSQIMNTYFSDLSADEQNKIVSECVKFETAMECPLIAGAENFIMQMRLRGVKTGLVTSSDDVKLERIIKKFNMHSWFDTVVTANRVTRSKPDPQCYLLAAEDLRANVSDCIVFEDSFAGIEAGRSAKMKVAALATTNSRRAIQETGNADLIIDNFVGFTYYECLNLLK
ncbi:MAG: four helix bundle protein [Prevotellaceae bacterium]|jgi:four helix bundle protein/HAD superfamily hydrolase (TIGR01509 family)|nr:four helix bundle protein [Prevotellaceae bacterium]